MPDTVRDSGLAMFKVELGEGGAEIVSTGLPVIAGAGSQVLACPPSSFVSLGHLRVARSSAAVVGGAQIPVSGDIEEVSHELYRQILAASQGMHLARIWNYVPSINATGPKGLENYKAFSKGRSTAFERVLGPRFHEQLPAASAVGRPLGALSIAFVAYAQKPRHLENPLQLPAYQYPCEYGPRAPSFARASVVSHAGESLVFVSGTASIRGHATVAPGDTRAQLDVTLENLREIFTLSGALQPGEIPGSVDRHFKVYLRNPSDLPMVEPVLKARLLREGDSVAYLQADICRKELSVEIEATVRRPIRRIA